MAHPKVAADQMTYLPSVPNALMVLDVGFVGGAICVGLSCVDQQLLDAAVPPSREDVVTFNGVRFGAGGAVPNTAIALSELGVPSVAALTQEIRAGYPPRCDLAARDTTPSTLAPRHAGFAHISANVFGRRATTRSSTR